MKTIKEIRQGLGLLQRECAERCGMATQQWQHIEARPADKLEYSTLRRVGQGFGMSRLQLVTEIES